MKTRTRTLVATAVVILLALLLGACGAPEGGPKEGPTARVFAYVDSTDGVATPILVWDARASTDSIPDVTAVFTWTVDKMPCMDILMGVSSNGEEFGILPTCRGVWTASVEVTDSLGRSDSATATIYY